MKTMHFYLALLAVVVISSCKKNDPAPATPPANPPVTNTLTQLEKDVLGYWNTKRIEAHNGDTVVPVTMQGPSCYIEFMSTLYPNTIPTMGKYKCITAMICQTAGDGVWCAKNDTTLLLNGTDWQVRYKAADSLVIRQRTNPGMYPEGYQYVYLKKK